MLFSNSNTCYEIYTTSLGLSHAGLSHADSIQTTLGDSSDYFKPDSLNTNYFSTNGTTIEPVPDRLALAPDRYYIKLLDGWAVPIQLTEKEARSLLPEVAEVRDRSQALNIVEGFCQRRSGVQS